MKIVDDGLKSVVCWGGGVAGGLGHGDPGYSTVVCVMVSPCAKVCICV
jgi:hypothetical protein